MKLKDDPQITNEDYQREWDEDEHLGLHDMQVGVASRGEGVKLDVFLALICSIMPCG